MSYLLLTLVKADNWYSMYLYGQGYWSGTSGDPVTLCVNGASLLNGGEFLNLCTLASSSIKGM